MFYFAVIFIAVLLMILAIQKFNMHPLHRDDGHLDPGGAGVRDPVRKSHRHREERVRQYHGEHRYRDPVRDHHWYDPEKTGAAPDHGQYHPGYRGQKPERADHGHYRVCDRYPGVL